MDAREIYVEAVRRFYREAKGFNYTEQQVNNMAQIQANNPIGLAVIGAFKTAIAAGQ